MNDYCAFCSHFIGGGDWSLCCGLKHEGYPWGFLCYEDTEACDKFEVDYRAKKAFIAGIKMCQKYIAERKPKTKGDEIRAMMDEEMAQLLDRVDSLHCNFTMGPRDCQESCENCWLEWLRSPVETDA